MIYETMPFGKYKGYLISEIPSNYLVYGLEAFELPEELKESIKEEVCDRLQIDNSGDYNSFKIKDAYKKMSKKYHPDLGGSTEAMQAINEFNSLLKSI